MIAEEPYGVYYSLMGEIPSTITNGGVLAFLQTKSVDSRHINAIKRMTNFNDDEISDWLNISVKTFRHYRKPEIEIKDNIKEHVLLLLSLMKHGCNVFESNKRFDEWLNTPNFFFDKKKPSSFLNTVTGIMYVDDRLTAMEYGDNI
jgi:putative toxin-antitoxin system antitoxin component (TIGR02293 family)